MGRAPAIALLAVALLVAGCSDSDGGSSPSTTTRVGSTGKRGDACARLVDVGNAILDYQEAQDAEHRAEVTEALEAFDRAAKESGDDELIEQAHIALDGSKIYFGNQSADAQDAGYAVNIAIDRAGRRCIDTGTVESVPTQPGS